MAHVPGHRWLMVADSDFLPANGGGEREHLGFARAALDAGWLAAVVLPVRTTPDLAAYRDLLGDVPLITTRRRTSPLMLAHPRYPYVVASRPYRRSLLARVRAEAPVIDGIVTFSYKSRLIGEGLAEALSLPMVVRQHNREGAYHRSLAAGLTGPRRLVMSWEAGRIERDEGRFDRSPLVTAVADISADDADARRAGGAVRVLHVPPFAFDARLGEVDAADTEQAPTTGRESDAPRVLFIGALDVVTNTTAIRWLLEHVWPSVLAAVPDATLDVVGRRPTDELRKRIAETARVQLHDDVPDMQPYLHGAAVAVNPAITGSGVNIKLVDYLQAGLPTVSTALATRGLPLQPEVDLLVRDQPADFAQAVVDLLADPERRRRVGESGRSTVTRLLDPRRNIELIATGFQS